MKRFMMIAIIALVAMVVKPYSVEAKIKVGYSTGTTTQSIHKFKEPFIVNKKGYNDFGVVFEQFSIMGVPIWNYGEMSYALFNAYNLSIDYIEISAEDLQTLSKELGVEFSDKPSLSFWNKIGGKLVLLLVIALIVVGYRVKNIKDEPKSQPVKHV